MKLILGTAQFGLNYGISQTSKAPDSTSTGLTTASAHNLLTLAQNNKISTLDTAYNYGDAESKIGQFHLQQAALSTGSPPALPFKVISKARHFTEAISITSDHVKLLQAQVAQSLSKTQVNHFEAMMVHQLDDIQKPGGLQLWETLIHHPSIKKTGISVYTQADIDWVVEHLDPDIIQLPFNILDQRLLLSGTLAQLKKRGIEVHARSIFLQGLLLMPIEMIEKKLPIATSAMQAFLSYCQHHDQTSLQTALQFACQQPNIDRVLIGVHSQSHLASIINDYHAFCTRCFDSNKDWQALHCQDLNVIDPRSWHAQLPHTQQ